MKCPKCGGTGEMQICEMGFIGKDECDKCHGKGYLNNEEWLRQCTTEQLAEWLVEHIDCVSCCCKKDLCCKDYDSCKLTFVEWLKQPHR